MNRIIQSGGTAAILLLVGISYNALCPAPAQALSLNTPLAKVNVNLPVGGATKALTNLTNSITENLPVSTSIGTSPDAVSVSAQLPVLSSRPNSAAPAVDVNVPVQPVTNTVRRAVPATSRLLPSQATANSNSPRVSTAQANSTSTESMTNDNTEAKNTSEAAKSTDEKDTRNENKTPFTAISSFLSSTLPNALQNFASGIVGKPVDILPAIISSVILLLTLGTVGGILYASNNNGVLALGRIGRLNLAKFAQVHDVAQIASLIIASIAFGIVASFLALTIL